MTVISEVGRNSTAVTGLPVESGVPAATQSASARLQAEPLPSISRVGAADSKSFAESIQSFLEKVVSILETFTSVVKSLAESLSGSTGSNTPTSPGEPSTEPPSLPGQTREPLVPLDIQGYLDSAFTGMESVNEEDAYLGVIGWGFNVMADFAGDMKVAEYYHVKKAELIQAKLTEGKTVSSETIGNELLREAVKDGVITELQAEHTKGNAFKASQFDENTSSLTRAKGSEIPVRDAITSIEKVLNKFISGELENEYRKL